MRTVILLLAACGVASASPSRPVPGVPVIECRNPALPHFRFELEAPPIAGPGRYARRITFWDGPTRLGDSTVHVVTSRHLTRVETGNALTFVDSLGVRFDLLEVDYSSMPARVPLGFTGEVTVMGAQAKLTCTRR